MPYNEEPSLSAIKDVLKTVYRLRAPGGCPWDREQTHATLRPFLVEETYETIEILDQIQSPTDLKRPEIKKAFIEEWGDVLLQILLHAEIASESDAEITIEAIAKTLNEKLIRRHPHVFGTTEVSGSNEVVKNWDAIKKTEKGNLNAPTPFLTQVGKGLPPIPRTLKVISKVSKVGFQWPDLKGPLEKLDEEVGELKELLEPSKNYSVEERKKIELELGDVMFSLCNIAHFLKMDPENALRATLRKFEDRFHKVEAALQAKGKTLEQSNLEEMDTLWNQIKKEEPHA